MKNYPDDPVFEQIKQDLPIVHANMGEVCEILRRLETGEISAEDAKQMAKRGADCLSRARDVLGRIRDDIQKADYMVSAI